MNQSERNRSSYLKNRELRIQRSKNHYYANRERYLISRKVSQYGISAEQYLEMVERQGNLCAACGEPETLKSSRGNVMSLCVDHDHETGQIRALLCGACNRALGHAKESVERLLALVDYLQGSKLGSPYAKPDPKPVKKPKKPKK